MTSLLEEATVERVLAAVRVGPSKTEIRDFPMPDVPQDSALLKMEIGGICGTGVKRYEKPRSTVPRIIGHEDIGFIAKRGRAFTRRKGFRGGDLGFGGDYVMCGESGGWHLG